MRNNRSRVRAASRGWRGAVLTVAVLTLGMTATACTASAEGDPSPAPSGNKPGVLLVHGAFADGSSWSKVAAQLQRDGYQVTTAAVPLRGLTYDAAYIRSVLDGLPGKTILVGHSFGGAVITNAATGSAKAAGLVYVAAFAPDQGEPVGALDAKFGGPATKIGVPHEFPLPGGGVGQELTVAPDKFHDNFAQDLPANDAAVLAAAQRPIAVTSFMEPSGVPAWKSLPSWALVAKDDRMIPADGQREMAKRMNATTVEQAGSHAVALSQPAAVTELIEAAAGTIQP
ncbi:alpha/beta fold hydrolase [Nocardia suismassiliense]|uniref:Alpha/beta fold hydrolase n=1 Tax=Nocardia suismassiliense TaxID=2077092 RepID=A0ABW6R199_9NOCA